MYDAVNYHTCLADIGLEFHASVSLCVTRTQHYNCVCCANASIENVAVAMRASDAQWNQRMEP